MAELADDLSAQCLDDQHEASKVERLEQLLNAAEDVVACVTQRPSAEDTTTTAMQSTVSVVDDDYVYVSKSLLLDEVIQPAASQVDEKITTSGFQFELEHAQCSQCVSLFARIIFYYYYTKKKL